MQTLCRTGTANGTISWVWVEVWGFPTAIAENPVVTRGSPVCHPVTISDFVGPAAAVKVVAAGGGIYLSFPTART